MINLLPKTEREAIHLLRIKRLIVLFGFGALVVFLVSAAAFQSMDTVLSRRLVIINTQLQGLFHKPSVASVLEADKGTQSFNALLAKVHALEQKGTPWSPALRAVASATPQSVTLTSIAIDAKAHTITIQGTAETRSDALLYQSNLANIALFDHIDAPLGNLVSEQNIHFTFTAFMKQQSS